MREGERERQQEIDDAQRRRQDLADFNNESAGVDVGRRQRFVTDPSGTDGGSQRKKDKDAFVDALAAQALETLRAQAYANAMQAYDKAAEAVETARDVVDTRLDRIGVLEAALEEERLSVLRGAQRLEDGSLVVWDEDGRARYPDGGFVPEEFLEGVVPDPGAFLWTQLEDIARREAELAAIKDRVQDQDARVGEIEAEIEADRARLSDEDDPPSAEELEAITERLDEKRAELEAIARPSDIDAALSRMEAEWQGLSPSADPPVLKDTALPAVNAQFTAAVNGEALPPKPEAPAPQAGHDPAAPSPF